MAAVRTDDAMNAAWKAADRYIVTPVAAARFILAKMRAAEGVQPRLGGVYMLGSCARAMVGEPFARRHFIIGDFFVVDKGSKVRFDEAMTLKEDYDFTCSHLKAHGSVMRCQLMTLNVKHYANYGGACTNRDSKGESERRNIAILRSKWPGVFRDNPKRQNEVIMKWRKEDNDDNDGSGDGSHVQGAKSAAAKATNVRKVVSAATSRKAVKKPFGGLKPSAKIARGEKTSGSAYLNARIRKAIGKKVGDVVGTLVFKDRDGNQRVYRGTDLKYDIQTKLVSLFSRVPLRVK